LYYAANLQCFLMCCNDLSFLHVLNYNHNYLDNIMFPSIIYKSNSRTTISIISIIRIIITFVISVTLLIKTIINNVIFSMRSIMTTLFITIIIFLTHTYHHHLHYNNLHYHYYPFNDNLITRLPFFIFIGFPDNCKYNTTCQSNMWWIDVLYIKWKCKYS
jgi:hypothetical protein